MGMRHSVVVFVVQLMVQVDAMGLCRGDRVCSCRVNKYACVGVLVIVCRVCWCSCWRWCVGQWWSSQGVSSQGVSSQA